MAMNNPSRSFTPRMIVTSVPIMRITGMGKPTETVSPGDYSTEVVGFINPSIFSQAEMVEPNITTGAAALFPHEVQDTTTETVDPNIVTGSAVLAIV